MKAHVLATALTVCAVPAQTVTFLEGSSAADVAVYQLDESQPQLAPTAVATGLSLLPIEITNRTSQDALRADRPRLVRRSGVARVELPDGGRLLRYRRQDGGRYGFLHVDASGAAHFELELAGNGANGRGDPFADRIGIAPDGRHAVAITANQLWLVRLDGSAFPNGTSNRRVALPAAVEPRSVCVGPSQVVFQAGGRLYRCPFATAVPADVTPAPALLTPMAPSGDGRLVALVAGRRGQQTIWLLGETGPAVALPVRPSAYEAPGYLPESHEGPHLLLNGDGSRLLYTDVLDEPEFFLLDTTGATTTTHITSPANFMAYIGIGVLPAFAADTLVIGLGHPDLVDWYLARTGGVVPVNVTGTAPTPVPPFGIGKLAARAAHSLPDGSVLIEEMVGDTGPRLRLLDPATARSSLLAARLRGPLEPGRSVGPSDVLVPDDAGDQLLSPLAGPLLQAPRGVRLSPDSRLAAGGMAAFVASLPEGGPGVGVLRLANGQLLALPADPTLRELVLTTAGGLVENAAELHYGRAGVWVRVRGPATFRVVL